MRIGNSPRVVAQINPNFSTSQMKLEFLPDFSSLAEENVPNEDDFETCLSGASLPIGNLFGQIRGAMGAHDGIHV